MQVGEGLHVFVAHAFFATIAGMVMQAKLGLRQPAAQIIVAGVLVPDGCREQALHPIQAVFSGVFGDLPAAFARQVAEYRLQVAQGMLVDFGTREVGSQPRMELAQAQQPGGDLMEGGGVR